MWGEGGAGGTRGTRGVRYVKKGIKGLIVCKMWQVAVLVWLTTTACPIFLQYSLIKYLISSLLVCVLVGTESVVRVPALVSLHLAERHSSRE